MLYSHESNRRISKAISEHQRFEKRMKIAVTLLFIITAIFITSIIYVYYLGISAALDLDWSNGLKGVLEIFWCGKSGCM